MEVPGGRLSVNTLNIYLPLDPATTTGCGYGQEVLLPWRVMAKLDCPDGACLGYGTANLILITSSQQLTGHSQSTNWNLNSAGLSAAVLGKV